MDKPVLLLNASYEPICSIAPQRAVVMILDGEVDIVSEYEGRFIRSPSTKIPYPSVVRLVRYVKVPRFRKAYLTRKAVLHRDNRECGYCGDEATTMDHIVPRSRGGAHAWENVVACCFPCNQRKDDKTLEEIGWKLRMKPYKPEGAKRVAVSAGRIPREWETWLDPAA
jgi:5-methylcytosine-specific restriction endonuclease McrA